MLNLIRNDEAIVNKDFFQFEYTTGYHSIICVTLDAEVTVSYKSGIFAQRGGINLIGFNPKCIAQTTSIENLPHQIEIGYPGGGDTSHIFFILEIHMYYFLSLGSFQSYPSNGIGYLLGSQQILEISVVVIRGYQYNEFFIFDYTIYLKHYKITVLCPRGTAHDACNSEDIAGWGFMSSLPVDSDIQQSQKLLASLTPIAKFHNAISVGTEHREKSLLSRFIFTSFRWNYGLILYIKYPRAPASHQNIYHVFGKWKCKKICKLKNSF